MSSFFLNFFLNKAPYFQDIDLNSNEKNIINNEFSKPIRKKKSYNRKLERKEPHPLTLKTIKTHSEVFPNSDKSNTLIKDSNSKEENSIRPKKIKCKCIYSHCLKQYCDCFAAGEFCVDCFCSGCENTEDHPLIEKNKNLKVKPIPTQSNFLGCNCTNSHCQKKYCECFKNGTICSPKCHCHDCKNKDPKKIVGSLLFSNKSSNISKLMIEVEEIIKNEERNKVKFYTDYEYQTRKKRKRLRLVLGKNRKEINILAKEIMAEGEEIFENFEDVFSKVNFN